MAAPHPSTRDSKLLRNNKIACEEEVLRQEDYRGIAGFCMVGSRLEKKGILHSTICKGSNEDEETVDTSHASVRSWQTNA